MIKMLTKFLGGNVLGGANKLAKTFFGSKDNREHDEHRETMAFLRGVSNEMMPRKNRTWWDSLVDGINRLVRPIFTFGTIYVFYYCIDDPDGFSFSMLALSLMPEQGWWFLFTVLSFWFGGKFIGKDIKPPNPINPDAVIKVIKAKKEYEDSQPKVTVSEPDGDGIFASIREHVKDLDPEAALDKLLGKK